LGPCTGNEGLEQKLHNLDRLVLDRLTDASDAAGILYQTVRCPFEEGANVYPGLRDNTRQLQAEFGGILAFSVAE
jgi:hypothetical protein